MATPGRILDLLQDPSGSLSNIIGSVECIVFDEFDRMVELGQMREVKKVM